jgi:hypothetical protein
MRSSESDPGRTRPIGPREVVPPPKKASKTSPSPPKPPKPLPAAAAFSSVDDAALLRVAQHLVGDADLLEPRLRAFVGVDVGVQFTGQLPIGTLDLRITRAPAHSEQPVIIACHA